MYNDIECETSLSAVYDMTDLLQSQWQMLAQIQMAPSSLSPQLLLHG